MVLIQGSAQKYIKYKIPVWVVIGPSEPASSPTIIVVHLSTSGKSLNSPSTRNRAARNEKSFRTSIIIDIYFLCKLFCTLLIHFSVHYYYYPDIMIKFFCHRNCLKVIVDAKGKMGRSSALQNKENEEGLWRKHWSAIRQFRNTIDNSISPNEPNIVRMLKGNCPVVRWDNAVTNFP